MSVSRLFRSYSLRASSLGVGGGQLEAAGGLGAAFQILRHLCKFSFALSPLPESLIVGYFSYSLTDNLMKDPITSGTTR